MIGRSYVRSERLIIRATIAGLLALVALTAAAPAFAQKAPIPIPESTGPAVGAVRAVSVISKPGSYILTRNISVKKAGMDGVDVNASDVTIDMQGYTISGVAGIATGAGINAGSQTQVTIKNGFITGMGGAAVIVGGLGAVSGINASGDSSSGPSAVIQAGSGSIVSDNTVFGPSTSIGISCSSSCLARGNILRNTAGMQFNDATSGYAENVLNGSGTQVSGGTQIGQNLCNGSLCP